MVAEALFLLSAAPNHAGKGNAFPIECGPDIGIYGNVFLAIIPDKKLYFFQKRKSI